MSQPAGHRRRTALHQRSPVTPRTGSGRRPRAAALTAILAVGLLLPACEARPYVVADCTPAARAGHSVARIWDDETLALIRQVVPAPTVHARNLFHLSVAMWDAWAAYDDAADGYVVNEKHDAGDVTHARETAISYAAYRILLWRYAEVADLATATQELDATMASLCYRTDYTAVDGDTPADLGNRIAAAVLESGRSDGSLEELRYVDSAYVPANDPLPVAEPGPP